MEKRKAIWVTGASSGIGKELALGFADKGFNVIASARNEELLKKNFAEKKNVFIFPLDVRDNDRIKETYSEISESFFVTVLINNAGITSFLPVAELDDETVENVVGTNLIGAINIIRAVLPEMIAAKEGTIVNILSVAAEKYFNNSALYSATKAGLKIFARNLREEVRKHSVRVVNIYPGATRTPIWPSESLEKYANEMLSPVNVADVVFDVVLKNTSVSVEEVVVRPVSGDLD